MVHFFQYSLESAICLAVLLLPYLVWFKKTTFHQWNRFYLLGAVLFSLSAPLLNIEIATEANPIPDLTKNLYFFEEIPQVKEQFPMEEPLPSDEITPYEQPGQLEISSLDQATSQWDWMEISLIVYVAGLLVFGSLFLFRLTKLFRLIRKAEKHREDGFVSVHLSGKQVFSFFSYIFLDKHRYKEKERATLLHHEQVHIQQWHSLDVLALEILQVVFWFNPLYRFYRKFLQQEHEYFVDATTSKEIGQPQYAQLLLSLATTKQPVLGHAFAYIPIKHRIFKLFQKPSTTMERSKFLVVLPFIFVLSIVFSCRFDSKKEDNIEWENGQIIEVGKKAPDYLFKKVMNHTKGSLSISELGGKPLIIEFWATWCRPCIPAMEKLDSLQHQFQDEVSIITVSPEAPERLERFLANTGNTLPIAIDTNYHRLFPPYSIPRSVLIGSDGIVRAVTKPRQISQETIEQLIAGEILSLEQEETPNPVVLKEVYDNKKNIVLKSYDASIGQYFEPVKNTEGQINGYTYYNYTLPHILQHVFDITVYDRVLFMDGLKKSDFSYSDNNNRYVLSIEVSPGLEEKRKEITADFMNANFDIYAKKAVKEMDCHVLTVKERVLKESKGKEEKFEFTGDRYIAKKQKLKQLILYIENMQNIIVADKTGMEGLYDIEFEWEFEKPGTLHKALSEYGLELKKSKEKLPVEVLEIHKRS